jgi:hypothetical protein
MMVGMPYTAVEEMWMKRATWCACALSRRSRVPSTSVEKISSGE